MEDKKYNLLVIDDDESYCDLIMQKLKNHEFECMAINDSLKGLALAREKRPDCILIDNLMPEMNGQEFCLKLKQEELLKDTPVLMLTALEGTKNLLEGLRSGVNDYIGKSVSTTQLVNKIRSSIEFAKSSAGMNNVLKCKEEFTHMVEDELKEPLKFIQAQSQEILQKGRLSNNLRQRIKDINQKVSEVLNIVDDIFSQ